MPTDSDFGSEIAYFTMEVGLEPDMHTYSGGLGVLAGDTIKSFADLEIPAVGITQLNKKGYISQKLDELGNQIDYSDDWNPEEFLELLPVATKVEVEGKEVKVRVWKKEVKSSTDGFTVPVLFLDTDTQENEERFRNITNHLYIGDQRYRFFQEVVLGIAGIRILKELKINPEKYHINESHSSLLTLELLKNNDMNPESVKKACVFTTHTSEKSGHDTFSYNLVSDVLRDYIPVSKLQELSRKEYLDMTELALNMSDYANAVSKSHGEISQKMFPEHQIDSITNGVYVPRWVSEEFAKLYDKYLQGWKNDPYKLRQALTIPNEEIWKAHIEEKRKLIDFVNSNTSIKMDKEVFTMVFARRATLYKRANLLFADPNKLVEIAKNSDFQLIFAGKAHPQDFAGKEIIRDIFKNIRKLENIKIVYLEDYDMELAKLLTSGADLWLNTPERGREACGTSGMKAACNGIPQLSTMDGWWNEGHLENITGWSIGTGPDKTVEKTETEASDLYKKLENVIVPKFYTEREEWTKTMLNTISINASYFNSNRMVQEYVSNAYKHK